MSWNKPSYNQKARNTSINPVRYIKGVLAGFICIAASLIAYWFVVSNDAPELPEKADVKSNQIAEVSARLESSRSNVPATTLTDETRPLKPQRVGEIRDGRMLMPDGRLRKMAAHAITTGVERITIVDKTFDEPTDRMLAHILEIEPGEAIVGDPSILYDGFEKEFVKSLNTKIVYDSNDSQYVRELKAGVLALRKELMELQAKGEDINHVLAENMKQVQELGLYRQELEDMVIEMTQKKDLTQESYDEIVTAANKMLEERGSKPLELPAAVKHRIKVHNAKHDTEQE